MKNLLGCLVNGFAILLGGAVGLFFRKGIQQRFQETVVIALGLAICLIGLQNALQMNNVLLLIGSLVLGSVLGEGLNIEHHLQQLGNWVEGCFGGGDGKVATGFVTATLLFCIGSMAIVGSLQSGVAGDHSILFAKAALDGVLAVFFASTLGWGVLLSALPVVFYEGILTLSAGLCAAFMTAEFIGELSAVGGVLIIAIGVNLLEMKKIRTGNMLPAIFIPFLYYGIMQLLG